MIKELSEPPYMTLKTTFCSLAKSRLLLHLKARNSKPNEKERMAELLPWPPPLMYQLKNLRVSIFCLVEAISDVTLVCEVLAKELLNFYPTC